MKLQHRRTEKKIWLVDWKPAWESAKLSISNPNYGKMSEEFEANTMSTSGMKTEPIDKKLDNLASKD